MVSRRRFVTPGYVYHVLNRGTCRQPLFFSDEDFADFESLVQETQERTPLTIFTYALMPNHWHFVVKPVDKEELSSFFQYLAGTHGKRFHAARRTVGEGHVYQDRFKSFPVECDGHFLAVCRYVERNALRAELVSNAEDWNWSALWRRKYNRDEWLTSNWPVRRADDWIDRVNRPLAASELAAIRRSIRRGSPLGTPSWAWETARRLGIEHTMRSPGRPRIARVRQEAN